MDALLPPMMTLLGWALPALLADFIFRNFLKLSWVLFGLIPLLLIPYWVLQVPDQVLFGWLKFSLLFPMVATALLVRTFPKLKTKWPFLFFKLFLVLNIGVAAVGFWVAPSLPNYLNGIGGLLLICTIPPRSAFSISSSRDRELLWDVSFAWIGLYTLWNCAFVYLFLGNYFLQVLPTLIIPLILSLRDRRRWFQSRMITLYAFIVFIFTFYSYEVTTRSPLRIEDETSYVLALVVFLYSVVYSIYFYIKKYKLN